MSERFGREALRAPGQAGFSRESQVPFHHVDAAGIVFYARIFEWFHEVYVAFLADAGFPLPEQLRARRFVAPLTHADADYLRPLRFGDPLVVAIVDAEVSDTRVRLGYRVEGPEGVAVTGTTVHVFVDPETFHRAAMPDGLRQAFERLERRSGTGTRPGL